MDPRPVMLRFITGKFLLLFLAPALLFLVSGCSSPEKRLARGLEEAKEALQSGDVNQAIDQLLEINEAFPGNPDVLEQLGFAYVQEPDPFSAAIFLQQAVDADPTRTYLLDAVAENYSAVGDRQSAKTAYARYLEDFPDDADAWYAIAELYQQDNQTRPAVDAFLKAFQLRDRPVTGEEAIIMGDLFFRLDNIPRAEGYYQQALEADPLSGLPALFGLLQINAQAGNWPVVERVIERLDADYPGALDASQFANLRLDLKAWEEARARFEARRKAQEEAAERAANNLEATIGSPTRPDPLTDGETVADASETAADRNGTGDEGSTSGESPAVGTKAARTEVPEPSSDGSVTVLPAEQAGADDEGKLAGIDPGDPVEFDTPDPVGGNVVGGIFDPLDDMETIATELPPVPADVAEARRARLQGDYTTAVRLLWRALGKNPSRHEAWYELSLSYLGAGDPASAETASLEAMRLNPRDPAYALHHVDVIRESRSPSYVIRELRRAKERFPDNPEITFELAVSYEEISRDPRNAIFLYREFLEIAPNHPLTGEVENKLRRLGAR